MRKIGIAITLVGIAVLVWFAVLSSPQPASTCGNDPNVVVAWQSLDGLPDGSDQLECRRLALVGLAKGLGLSAPLITVGLLIAVSAGASDRSRQREEREHTATVAAATRQRPSSDGTKWWDGYRWQTTTRSTRSTPDARPPVDVP